MKNKQSLVTHHRYFVSLNMLLIPESISVRVVCNTPPNLKSPMQMFLVSGCLVEGDGVLFSKHWLRHQVLLIFWYWHLPRSTEEGARMRESTTDTQLPLPETTLHIYSLSIDLNESHRPPLKARGCRSCLCNEWLYTMEGRRVHIWEAADISGTEGNMRVNWSQNHCVQISAVKY